MTKAQLLVIAEDMQLSVSRSNTKAEIIAAILDAQTIESVPTQNGTLTYTGEAQSPVWDDYDTKQLAISGATSGTDAGTYTATFTPIQGEVSGHEWYDETFEAKNATWEIGKAAGSITLSADSATLSSETTTAEITVTATGAISVDTDDAEVATATESGGTITITRAGAGTATITVTSAASDNYESTTADITVTSE